MRPAGLHRIGMMSWMNLADVFPWYEWLALAWFFVVWAGYAWYSRAASARGETLLAVTNRWRRAWLVQASMRDNRIVDSTIVQTLSNSPSFFASTTILIIGGLLALLGTSDKAAEMVRELPFAARTSMLALELKLLLLLVIFTFAFFRFTWSIRQYTFAALMVGAMPPPGEFATSRQDREAFADQGAALVGMAAESFNDGVRAYYFAFAAVAWLASPLAFVIGAALVVAVLYGREFRSNVLTVLRGR